MDPASVIAQLKDVHPPELITWWPLAIGWWCLIALTITLLTSITVYSRRWWHRNAWRRAALSELKQAAANYKAQPDTTHLITVIELLKRSVSSAHNDLHALSATSDEWRHYLEKGLRKSSTTLSPEDVDILSEGHYQLNSPNLSTSALVRIEQFIKRLENV